MTKLVPCTQIAEDIITSIKEEITEKDFNPTLSIYSNPEDKAAQKYVQNKLDAAARCGITAKEYSTALLTEDELLKAIKYDDANGIIIQSPVEERLRPIQKELLRQIHADQDVDGLTPEGFLRFVPATPKGIFHILDWIADDKGIDHTWPYTNTVIVGRSELVGRPLAADLIRTSNMTVTVCNSKTRDVEHYTRYADVVITACGVPGRITKEMVAPGSTLIDVGISVVDGKLVGDAAKDCEEVCAYIARMGKQGGPGKLTVAGLLENVLKAYKIQNGIL